MSESKGGVYIGLDVGSQSVKLLVYDDQTRRVLAHHGQPLQITAGDDGSREQRAEWWIDAIRACFARLSDDLRARVVALGVSGQQHGLVALDAAGKVLAPAKLWCDTSTQRECDEIMQAVGGAQQCMALAGNPILAGYTASKVPWTRRHRPEAYSRMQTILLPHDYVNFWLTGERWMECGDASGTGWLDVRTRTWSKPLLAATDPDRDLAACLPPLVAPDATFTLAPTSAEELGLPRGVLVSAGGGDNMMAAIGTGNVVPGVLSMSLGTSGTLFTHSERPVIDDGAAWAAFCSSTGGWLPLICTMNCTSATESVAKAFGFSSRDGDSVMTDTAPGAEGLSMLPFFNGERTPDLPNARASLSGMSTTNFNRGNVYRAAMEGATFALRNGFDALQAVGLSFDSIRLTGGGSNSAVWRQMVADVFDLPVGVPEQPEGAAFGAALQALWAHRRAAGDAAASLADIVQAHVSLDAQRSTRPDSGVALAYQAHYRRFLSHLDLSQQLYGRPAAATAAA
jgi:xylulokinase